MKPRLFPFVAAASLVLLLATVVMWLSSHRNWHVFGYRGQLIVVVQSIDVPFEQNPQNPGQAWATRADRLWQLTGRPECWRGIVGFGIARADRWYNYGPLTLVTVPFWFIVLMLAIPPSLWARRWRLQSRRAERGLCMACGYDRRATPRENCCPECGTMPQAGPRAAA